MKRTTSRTLRTEEDDSDAVDTDQNDTGNDNTDSGNDNTDSGSDNTDSGETASDDDTADSSDTSSDDDSTDSGDTISDDDTDTGDTGTEQECTGLSLNWPNFAQFGYLNRYRVDSADYEKTLVMTVNQSGSVLPGTYDLGSKKNSDLKCTECVLAYTDPDDDGYFTKIYFQKSGTLKIDAVDENYNIKGTLNAVLALAEFGEDEDDEKVYFIDNGGCFEIETVAFDSGYEEPCVPQCEEEWICGDDGCGGTCGDGCGDQACAPDHLSCVDMECETLTIGEVTFDSESYSYYAYVVDNAAGETDLPDMLLLEFYDVPVLGNFDLSLSYDDCDYCMFLYEDFYENEGNLYYTKKYFPQSGTLTFTQIASENSYESAGTASFRLVEAEDDNSLIEGGKCYDVENLQWDTICKPQCGEGWVCGGDGCGGTCGEGCGSKACSEDHKSCVELVLDDCSGLSIPISTLTQYTPNKFYATNASEDPIFWMQFFQNDSYTVEAGTYNLASDDNLNFETCTECVFMQSGTKMYYQHEGTLVVNIDADNHISGTISAKLAEADISGLTTIFTEGGECFEIEAGTAFAVQAAE